MINLKSRIQKLEVQLIKPDSEFCGCPRQMVTFVIKPTMDNLPPEDELPEICPDCRKPIEMQVIKPATFNINTTGN